MAEFASIVLTLACTYMLMGVGYVVVYRASKILNFAHGALVMLGAYFAFTLGTTLFPDKPYFTIVIALLLSSAVGLLIYRLAIQSMLGRPAFIGIILTIGIFMIIEGIVILVWGSSFHSMSSALGIINRPHPVPLGFTFATFDLAIIIACIAFLGGLAAFYRFTRLGMQMRGASENTLLAAQRGISIYAVIALAWGIAGFGAGLAGTLYSANTNLAPGIDFTGLKAFTVPLVGGMDSLLGVIPGGLIIALVEALAMRYIDPILADVAPMIIILVVLIARPWGLFGSVEEIERV